MLIMLLVGASVGMSNTAGEREQDWDYIVQPGNIPLCSDFDTPQIESRSNGSLSLNLKNRYKQNITNVTLTVDIYLHSVLRETGFLDDMLSPPEFVGVGGNVTSIEWADISPNETKTDASFLINSVALTLLGTYFVRLQLTFEYNGSSYIMKSRGHFTDEHWEDATTNTSPNDPGNVNITHLGVDGIIPDTTFGVEENEGCNEGLFIPGFMGVEIVGALLLLEAGYSFQSMRKRYPISAHHTPPPKSSA